MPETMSELERESRLTRFTGEAISSDVALQTAIQRMEGNSARYADLGSALIKLAMREQEAGNHPEAEALFGKALVVGERALGSDHPALLPALIGLGVARMSRGATTEAEATLTRGLAICESQVGEDEPELVILLTDLARLCLKQSLHALAEPALLRLLAIKRSKGEDRPEVATVLASLAFVHQSMGRHQSAEQMWTRVVEIREQTLAPNHFSVATALEHLADSCTARGKIGQALQLLQRAQAIREITLGKDHSSLQVSRERVADLQLQASEDYLEHGPEHGDPAPPSPLPELARLGSGEIRNEHRPAAETASAAIPPRQSEPVPYREMILSMQAELEPAEQGAGLRERASLLMASAAEIFRKRDRSVEIGVAAMTLVLIAFVGSRAWGKMEDAAVQEVSVDSGAPATGAAFAPIITRPSAAVDESLNAAAARDASAAAVVTASRPRAVEKTAAARAKTSEQSVNRIAALPKAVTVNLDSVVRTMNTPGRDIGEAILSQPASTMTAGRRPSFGFDEAIPARHVRLIGSMPVPRYPTQLTDVGGEVLIRFMVDTLGRPMMATFSALSSPDTRLTTAVKDVVPRMRFEPARTAGPASRPTSEWVETVFRFER